MTGGPEALQTLLFDIGRGVSSVVFRLWLENSPAAKKVGLKLNELIRVVFRGKESRRLARQFEEISEGIAERLEPFFEAEFGDLPDNEKRAAGEAVRRTLESVELNDSLLFATDLEPQALEEAFRRSDPEAAKNAYLSEAGRTFYDQVLREAANCIVEIRMELPDFESKAAQVLLSKNTELIELVHTILDRLPPQAYSEAGGEAAVFESQYKRDIARKLDQLELFGVMTTEARNQYPLSVAYLTLTGSTKLPIPDEEPEEEDAEEAVEPGELKDRDGRTSMPVDTALARTSRVLVRGEAGSGKTTLLQWIAVNSARDSLPDSLVDWKDSIPFLVQLRRFVDTDLPGVEEFVVAVNAHFQQPEGWARRLLADGRGLVLVDGIDELPEERREEARQWLADLVELYPDSRYVVTSRPPAAGEDWLAGQGFDAVLLESLELPAIRAFIDHWHDAAQTTVSAKEEKAELRELAIQLKETIWEKPAIRNLAGSPLLCAMLCALNRSRRAQLPSDRVELYRIGLEMLLERRDIERKLKGDIVNLGLGEKEVLLRAFAWWLLNNGKSFALKEDLEDMVSTRLEVMPGVDAPAPEVVKHLLVRSGLLRQPSEDRIDFIHRTFQEYLAAKEAIKTRSMGVLVGHAHLDQWQEVVVLAAGLADLPMREELITGLIRRGEEEEETRHRVHLLAVDCLETSAELSLELANSVKALLEELIPPKSITEAQAIASAGEVAVPLLGQQAKGAHAAHAAACVRALTLIGGESGLMQLERFGPDSRVTVARELLRAWTEFPAEEYARRVLRDSMLDYGEVEMTSAGQLPEASHLRNLDSLVCDGSTEATPGDEWPWEGLGALSTLQQLMLRWIPELSDLSKLQSPSQLRGLYLLGLPDLVRFSAAGFPALERLSITDCKQLDSAAGVSNLKQLASLRILSCRNLVELPRPPARLERAYFSRLDIEDLTPLERGGSLKVLGLNSCRKVSDLTPITSHPSLGVLELNECSSLHDLAPVAALSGLYALSVSRSGGQCDPAALADCTELKRLVLEDFNFPPDGISWIENLGQLRVLSLSGSKGLRGVPAVKLPNLRRLYLSDCSELEDLSGLQELRALEHLYLDSCESLTDLLPLQGHPTLTRISLRGCRQIRDLSPLAGLPALKNLDIRGTNFDARHFNGSSGVKLQRGPRSRLHTRNRIGTGWNWGTDLWRAPA